MFVRRTTLTSLLVLLVAVVPVLGLELGDDAPPLAVEKWVKGDPIDLKAGLGKNVYVVEFWATWCGPCIRGIPHLTELQKKHRDDGLVVIGISSADKDLEAVTKFVQMMDDRMEYTVAYESKQLQKSSKAYMDGFNKKGIPQCFVVDKKGKIVWEGHPMFGLDAVIEAVLAGECTVEKLAEIGEKAAKETEEKYKAREAMVAKYFEMVSGLSDALKAAKLGDEILKELASEADMLNGFSWRILTDEDLKVRDKNLALRAAKAANEASGGKDASVLDTYAKALFETGSLKEALELQRKAVELAQGNERILEALTERLKEYEAASKR